MDGWVKIDGGQAVKYVNRRNIVSLNEGNGIVAVLRNGDTVRMKELPQDKPTAKSYIQDGLVAIWDGIENAGWGVHDANARVWKDLVGSCDLTLNASFAEVLADGIRRETTSAHGPVASLSFTYAAPMTMEMCTTTPASLVSGSQVLLSVYPVNQSTNKVPCLVVKTARFFQWSFSYDNQKTVFPPSTTVSLAATSQGYGYANGIRATAGSTDKWSFPYNTLCILGDGRNQNYSPFGFTAHCVRIYSRALTADEIAANYAIDKERFNFP